MKILSYIFPANFYRLLSVMVLVAGVSVLQAQGENDIDDEEDIMPELGVYIPLKEGFVNLRIVEGHFELYFLDAEKKVIEAVYTTAYLKYENVAKKDREGRVTLNLRSGGEYQYLTSGRVIKRPYRFWINILFKDSKDPDKRIPFGRHRLSQ